MEIDDDRGLRELKFDFVSIISLRDRQPPACVDIIGVVIEVNPLLRTATGNLDGNLYRRSLVLADQTGKVVPDSQVTVWKFRICSGPCQCLGRPRNHMQRRNFAKWRVRIKNQRV